MMRKKCCLMLVSALIAFGLCACGGNTETDSTEQKQQYIINGEEVSEEEYQKYLAEQETLQDTEITEAEKAAIYTIQQLQEVLKNPHSLEIYSINYKRSNEDNTGDYYIKVEYSAENNMGGRVEDTLYYKFDLNIFSEDSKKALNARLFGCEEVHFNDYDTGRRSDYEEIEIDIDRVLNNIDMEF